MNTLKFFKSIFVLLTLTITFLFFANFSNVLNDNTVKFHREIYSERNAYLKPKSSYKKIPCYFGISKTTNCVESNSIIYLPFDLVKKKFDINGKIDDLGNFKITPSNHKIFYPTSSYDSKGEFLWFGDQNVESRDRVKYISLIQNVPITSQWKKSGHFYPIQIAQYGLSHFSKWFTTKTKIGKIKNFTINQIDHFLYLQNNGAFIEAIENGFKFKFNERSIYKTDLNFDFSYFMAEVETNSSLNITIDLMLRDSSVPIDGQIIRLIYSFNAGETNTSEIFNYYQTFDRSYEILYRINGLNGPQKLIRNFCIDTCKALEIKSDNCFKKTKKIKPKNGSEYNRYYNSLYFKVYQIGLIGKGKIKNGFFFENSPSYEIAKQVTDFLVSAQNTNTGGWIINITRKFASNSKKIMLESGWYSAMAQGHAISLLCRLYSITKDEVYYESARKALGLFELDTNSNGVKANFMNTSLIWFEEYPTRPNNLYVLNGFVFSIFGLFDFLDGCQNLNDQVYFTKAKQLFENAVKSLTELISLFDTGTRTLYDLGHLVDAEINPNVARWDYHCLHVSQLNYLINILENLKPNFDQKLGKFYARKLLNIRTRWENYRKGIWYNKSQVKN